MSMWECNYSKEPFDLKLLLLQLLKNIWILVLGAISGMILMGGIYYLLTFYGKPRQYEIITTYYVDYAMAPLIDEPYTYINAYTWNEWIDSDEFISSIREMVLLPETITKEQVQQFFSADIKSDISMVYMIVKTEEPTLSLQMSEALKKALFEFAERQKEIQTIRVVNIEGVQPAQVDSRLLQAFILGSILGGTCILIIMGFRYICDDSIRIPHTFSYRYGIPMLGVINERVPSRKRELKVEGKFGLTNEVREHLKYVFQGKERVAITATDPDTDIIGAVQFLKMEENFGERLISVPWVIEEPGGADVLRSADGILLLVKAGAHNGKRIEKVLEFLRIQGCEVHGGLLWNADRKLIKAYFLL